MKTGQWGVGYDDGSDPEDWGYPVVILSGVDMDPAEARLLGQALIEAADKAAA